MSEFLNSEIVQKELYDMQNLYNRLSTLVEDLKSLEPDEKMEFLEQTKMLVDKQRIFHTRLTLAAREDETIKDIVENMDKLSVVFCGSSMASTLATMSDKLTSYMDGLTPPK